MQGSTNTFPAMEFALSNGQTRPCPICPNRMYGSDSRFWVRDGGRSSMPRASEDGSA